jgi:SNF2 family DNA or RNA helicase
MEIVDNVAVRLSVPSDIATTISSTVEKSAVLGDELLINWGHSEMMFLSRLFDKEQPNTHIPNVPSPILRDYNWPGIHVPFQHQKDTAAYLSLRQRAFCFNDAGTGKTSAAIWAADYLMQLGRIRRVLVICPLSIMYSAWRDDIFKTAMHRSCAVAHGEASKRSKIINSPYDFVIINYDGVNIVANDIAMAGFDLIIVDEANGYKNASTKRWKTLAKLVKSDTWLWMMTGTPASQSPLDAFGLARLISPERVPKYSTAWRDQVMYQASKFRWIPKADANERVFRALQPAIRFKKRECIDLPEIVYQTREVPLTDQVKKFYKALKTQMLVEAAGEEVSAVNAAANLNKLLQISGGAVYTDSKQVIEFDIRPRLAALQEVLDETSNKVVVFVPFLHTILTVTEYLTKQGVSCEVISGDVSARNRADIIGRFQTATDPRVLVIQPQSAAHGITLTAADTIVFWSPVMSVETYLQCIGRIERVGQKNSMTIVHLQGSEVERKVYSMLQGKVDSHLKLVELYKQELEA